MNDLRFAFRMLAKHGGFSALVISVLALGLGVNTTVFTLVHAVLFKPLPLPGGTRLVTVTGQNVAQPHNSIGLSYPELHELRENNRSFAALEAAFPGQVTLGETDLPPERVRMSRVSAGLFGMLRTPPALGRGFLPDDDQPGAEPVALISHRVWQSRYGGAADVLGRAVRIDGSPFTIVGVMPEGFQFPATDNLWLPLVPDRRSEDRAHRSLTLFGLLNEGVSLDEAQKELTLIGSRLAAEFPDTNQNLLPVVRTFRETYIYGSTRLILLTLLGAVGFVLLIVCANAANLLLGRAFIRDREISIRTALGARRWQIIRQLLVESVLLSGLGGVLGLGLSRFGIHAFDLATQGEAVDRPYWIQFTMDYAVFGYFAAISVLSGIAFGLVPALRSTRGHLNPVLKDGTASAGHRRSGRLTGALVVFQFALTLVLLAGAGLMMRSFFSARSLNSFISSERILTARIGLPEGEGSRYREPEARRRFVDELLPQLAALPGAAQVAATSHLPGQGGAWRNLEIEGKPVENPGGTPRFYLVVQTPGYLPMIGVPIRQGRGFAETDGRPGEEAAVVTREFAATHWPGQEAVGARFRFLEKDGPGPWISVIGICGDLVQNLTEENSAPVVFLSHRQEPWGRMALMIRSEMDPAALAGPVRSTVQAADADLALFEVQTLSSVAHARFWFLRVFGTLFLVFAAIGLVIASIGIYGVVAQAVAGRTREIGIRLALGATGAAILRLVLGRGLGQLAIGLGLGLAGALAATRVLAQGDLLIRVSPRDPLVFVLITLVLAALGLLACWLPARRAARLDPVEALRAE